MSNQYQKTIKACFLAYIVQAIINNFVPLLFLTFQRSYHIPLSQITMLVTFNFGVQLLIDFLAIGFVDKIGYRAAMIIAHILSAMGLIFLTILPEVLPSAFVGILISVMIYAMGGGLLEVLVSPVVEACPSDNKEKTMSMLHSFYCWGHVGVVLFSTIFFYMFGIAYWRYLTILWATIPMLNVLAFMRVPVPTLIQDGEKGLSLRELCSQRLFWILFLMMICAGASEQAVSQWASTFAEKGLGISKVAGDLAGPMTFAVLMGTSRAFYGKHGEHMKLDRFMTISCVLCIFSYLGISLCPVPAFSLISCGICGLSVGIMWPGSFSKAAKAMPNGGTAMFALLALAGDLGCAGGPTVVGIVSSMAGENLKSGIFVAALFPILLLLGISRCNKACISIDKGV